MSRQRSIRLRDQVEQGVETIAHRSGRDLSAVVNELLEEALRMRRIPGIVFADERSGREAKVAGTGLGVWEILRGFSDVDSDWNHLREAYHWLSQVQLRAALAYAEAYPEEIERRIRIDDEWTPERVYETYPFMRPPNRS